jgi:Holliday junction resolvase
MVNSRDKGKRGELEVVHWLGEHGITARRGQQYCGASGDPDVVCEGLSAHIEVKRTERLNVYEALAQAVSDAPEGKIPTVLHKKNRKDWVAVIRGEDWIKLMESYEREGLMELLSMPGYEEEG